MNECSWIFLFLDRFVYTYITWQIHEGAMERLPPLRVENNFVFIYLFLKNCLFSVVITLYTGKVFNFSGT